MKNTLISLSLLVALAACMQSAMANSAIYTDDLGRMHFLGKDPATYIRTNQINNIQVKEQEDALTDIIYKDEQNAEQAETNVNAKEQHTNKSKGSFTFTKGAMDASDPYTYGETNIKTRDEVNKSQKDTESESERRPFWERW